MTRQCYTPISPANLKEKILLVPIVSTANLSQLSFDLLIASLDLKRVGVLDDSYCVAGVGGLEDEQDGGVTLPLEVYTREDLNIVLVQQRTPVLKAYKETFIQAITTWIQSTGFAAVVLVSGLDMRERVDSQMSTPTYHLQLQSSPIAPSTLKSLDLSSIPPLLQSPTNTTPRLPGTGLTLPLLSLFSSQATQIPSVAILQFAMEGDNRSDAHFLARKLLTVLQSSLGSDLKEMHLKEPTSWQGIFGIDTDQTLFG